MIKVCGVLASSAAHAEITDGSISPTLMARAGTGGNQLPLVALETIEQHSTCYAIDQQGGKGNCCYAENVMPTICSDSHGTPHALCYWKQVNNDMLPTYLMEVQMERTERKYVLRRLTPTECARLQGFPDWWTDGANGSDSNIYKMWGNGIALPCAVDVLGRIAKEVEEHEELP